MTPETPRQGAMNDFNSFQYVLSALAEEFGLPYKLLVAQFLQESAWKLKAYRYEPNYDRRYISSTKGKVRWSKDPSWITAGPTCADWFMKHPSRAREKTAGQNYSFVAQTKIAASYGICQVMLPTARDLGFYGVAEELFTPEACRWGVRLLAIHYRQARAQGWREREALMIALARYNGGAVGNNHPGTLRNMHYVRLVDKRYRECWGTSYFGG